MISQYIRTPFATSGDKQEIPQSVQSSGDLSWPEGWGPDYELDLENDADAKPIDRLNMNQLFNVITVALKFLQENYAPEWITSQGNGGSAFRYQKGQTVTYTNSDNVRSLWTSLVNDNNTEPGTDATKWQPAPYRVANSSEIESKAGDYPTTPAQVVKLIEALRVEIPNGSITQRGIVQLSNVRYGSSATLAATEQAVGGKLNLNKNSVGNASLDTFNTADSAGLWVQTSDTPTTTDNNYPPNASAGLLLVAGNVYGWPVQVYFVPLTGQIWSRRRRSAQGDYGEWKEAAPAVQSATTSQRGVVQLSDTLNGTSQSKAATENAVGQKITMFKNALGATNLNTIADTSKQGVYYQSNANNATSARNYPESYAGTLYALGTIENYLFQMYVSTNSNIWTRYYNTQEAKWYPWKKANSTSPAGIIQFVAVGGRQTAPEGMLVCNGAAVSRDRYNRLFGVIGTRFGAGDGSTTFNLPKIDPGYTLVSNMGSSDSSVSTEGRNKAHSHTATCQTAGEHQHALSMGYTNRDESNIGGGSNSRWGTRYTQTAGAHAHEIAISLEGVDFNAAAGIYALPCISY